MKNILLLLTMLLAFAFATTPAKAEPGAAGVLIAIALAKVTGDGIDRIAAAYPEPACLQASNKPVMVQAKGANFYYATHKSCN